MVGRTVSAVVVTGFTYGVVGMERIRKEEEEGILGFGGRHSRDTCPGRGLGGLYMSGLYEIASQAAHLVPIEALMPPGHFRYLSTS